MAKQSTAGQTGLMTMPQCANYLHLSETTILKLASDGMLPGVLVGKKWQFERKLIDEWLAERLDTNDEDIEDIPDGMRVPLGDLLPEAAVLGDLQSKDALGTIEELAARAYSQKWLNDKPWFVGAVVERELLSSTAMEGGVAFLHTRAREGSKIARPFIIAGRHYGGVDFGAPDGKPTFLFFLLGLKHDRLHLPILGRLARTVRNPATIARLRSQPSATKIRSILLEEDARALSSTRQVPVRYEMLKPKLDRLIRLRTIKRLDAMRKREAEKEQKKSRGKRKAKAGRKSTTKEARPASETAAGNTTDSKPARAAKSATKKTAKSKQATAEKPATKPAGKKTTTKAPAKKATGKKPGAKKAGKKAANKKAPGQKSTAKKPAAKKPAAKKPAAKKPAAKKPATKKPATKKPAAKKPATKKPASKKKG